MIDLRSDTVTRPTPAMLDAMMRAKVGDDVFEEDSSINELEEFASAMFGMEAALFCPSGTMTNQLAIKCHTQPGDEVICDELSHVYLYEGGGIAANSHCSVRLLQGNRGRLTATQVEQAIQPMDVHKPISRLVSLENTANRGGGSCYDWADLEAIGSVCTKNQLAFHLDGARLFNALVAKKQTPQQYGALFNSISICLSKGLGAPVGSILLGDKAFIQKARRWRKVFGGGMRQAGFLAAAGLHALQQHVERLQDDHNHAVLLANALKNCSWVKEVYPVETNIVIFETIPEIPAKDFVAHMREHDIIILAMGSHLVRMVTHLDVSSEQIKSTIQAIAHYKV
ncbi:MAG: low-specificity L-threonine aldolase [Hydrotalea sp.]|nr:low-specificity L-threonine aldolase [Hydrotalea sp.]